MGLSMKRWAGKAAIVTGAATGFGRAIAKKLVQNGMKVKTPHPPQTKNPNTIHVFAGRRFRRERKRTEKSQRRHQEEQRELFPGESESTGRKGYN